jgi:predicted RNA-binding protein
MEFMIVVTTAPFVKNRKGSSMGKQRSYWVNTYTLKTWEEAKTAGGEIAGFRAWSKTLFETVSEGDCFLCYILKLKRFVAVQEVLSEAFVDDTPIWTDELFPYRVKVRPILKLDPETAVPVIELADRLSIFDNLKQSSAWGLYFQRSPRRWSVADGEKVVLAMEAAVKSPIKRPFDRSEFK